MDGQPLADEAPLRLASTGPRRLWFPIAWPLLLAGGCILAARATDDPGKVNTAIFAAVTLGVLGLAIWTIRSSGLPRWVRWTLAGAPTALLLALFMQVLPIELLNNGAAGVVGWRWRWADPDRALQPPEPTRTATTIPWEETPQDYPRFLGNGYWAEIQGVRLNADWKEHPPREVWRRPIGAGWSSFSVVGPYAFTQEQRGDEELVVCYDVATGEPLWTHADPIRWDPSGAGALGYAGPRATPTVHNRRVYAQGATGMVNCLDAQTGKLLWSRDTLPENHAKNTMWGKACSPLVTDGIVVVSVGAPTASLVAYDSDTGKEKWAAGDRRSSYASPIAVTLANVPQILVVNEDALVAHSPVDGKILWEHKWPSGSDSAAACSQPVPVGADRILLSKGYGQGGQLVQISRDGDAWRAEPVWSSSAVLKTKFSNVVIRDGYVYALDDVFMQCVDLETGKPKWKKRRSPSFGYGQILLVGDVILVLSEEGELILVEATPKKYRELAAMPALEGITWNNPTLVGPRLLVRNAEEAACYELPLSTPASDLKAQASR